MFNVQANTARFIYTINRPEDLAERRDEIGEYARLKNGNILTKVARSDEKVRITEGDMFAICRTTLFMYVFDWDPLLSSADIINTGNIGLPSDVKTDLKFKTDTATPIEYHDGGDDAGTNNKIKYDSGEDKNLVVAPIQRPYPRLMDVPVMRQLIDNTFGEGMARVARRVLCKCWSEYTTVWRLYPFHPKKRLVYPSAWDCVRLIRFVNATATRYSPVTMFLLENSTDNTYPNQGVTKYLGNTSEATLTRTQVKRYLQERHQRNNFATMTGYNKEAAITTNNIVVAEPISCYNNSNNFGSRLDNKQNIPISIYNNNNSNAYINCNKPDEQHLVVDKLLELTRKQQRRRL